ncbi:unnamed protein product [Blepharisma stoltei]|uniref:Uncharacterized protein n=1 Tax=Blepharisma stoltei TaxID=1481888 RepID=A0AAU9INC3_9CILI|nr:unnamed protein product [Blepharisma stoltei]
MQNRNYVLMDAEILILTEEEYEKFMQSQNDDKEKKLAKLPLIKNNDLYKIENEIATNDAAEKMLSQESQKHYLKILDSLDLSLMPGPNPKISPIRISDHKFLNKEHQGIVMERLKKKTSKHKCSASASKLINFKFNSMPTSPLHYSKKKTKSEISSKKTKTEKILSHTEDKTLQENGELKQKKILTMGIKDEWRFINLKEVFKQIESDSDLEKSPKVHSKALSSKRPSKKILKKYLTKANSHIPLSSERSTNPSEGFLFSGSSTIKHANSKKQRKKLRKTNSDSLCDLKLEKSFKPKVRSSQNQENQKTALTTLNSARSSYQKNSENSNSLGELMQLMFDTKSLISENISPKDSSQHKALNERIANMIKENPSELYKILNISGYSRDFLTTRSNFQGIEWTEEQEKLFKSMLRKSHSFNSIAKTRLFKEMERDLRPTQTREDIEWKYDKHSPWANDLDYNNGTNFQTEDKKKKARSSISNLKKIVKDREELDSSEEEMIKLNMLQERTGMTSSNLLTLQNQADYLNKVQEFEHAIGGLKMIQKWKKNKSDYESAKVKFADHIIGNSQIDVKQLNKSRYSYLSAKVAHQRAHSELDDKYLLEAEEKRKELRKRQESFQRDVTISRKICREMFGRDMKFGQRKILETTVHPLGSPRFKTYMIKLGFLPENYSPQPHPIKDFDPSVVKSLRRQIPKESISQLSLWNFKKSPQAGAKTMETPPLVKLQAHIKGYLVRQKVTMWRKAAIKIQKAYKWYRTKKFVLTALFVEQIATGNLQLGSLLVKYKDTIIYKKILKDIVASKYIQRMLIKRKQERAKSEENKSSSHQSSFAPKTSRSSFGFTPFLKSEGFFTFSEKASEASQRVSKRKLTGTPKKSQNEEKTPIPKLMKLEELPENAKNYFDSIKAARKIVR